MTTILLTNDDGYLSPGLSALQTALVTFGQLYVVAPEREQSAVSHAITLLRPLRITQRESSQDHIKLFTIDGSPADCVKLALDKILDAQPDLIVSGINRGANTGINILYSGTVSAAAEGTLAGIPSIALSRASYDANNFEPAAHFSAILIDYFLKAGLPPGVFLNVNFPNLALQDTKPFLITHQANRRYRDYAVENTDPRNVPYYWLKMKKIDSPEEPLSDETALRNGHISITPLLIDRTAHTYHFDLDKLNQTLL
ncbi:5'/3'-nucleotidase SurE [bacterium]|nr:5'/3'-nucleotidase SurE [bacterium]